mgnify:CR=1 FL=1
MRCKKCESNNIRFEIFAGKECMVCLDCGFDEREEILGRNIEMELVD